MNQIPAHSGYYFPAEFSRHAATWLSWPHKEASWPGKIQAIYPHYSQFVKELAKGEAVRINVGDEGVGNRSSRSCRCGHANGIFLFTSDERCLVQGSWACFFDKSCGFEKEGHRRLELQCLG